jgi:transcriptional regulator with PAS, ATPase and Fis domain
MDQSIFFVGDDHVAKQLEHLFEGNALSLKSLWGFDVDLALTLLTAARTPTLIVVCQAALLPPTTIALLQKLAARAIDAINVIAVGEGFIPAELVAPLDVLGAEYFVITARGTVRDEARFLNQLKTPVPRKVPESRHMDAFGVELKTYTPEFFQVVDDLVRVADRNVTLLIIGETGAGKTTLAKLIHSYSQRRGHPFQHLACGALPPDLIESELFGHVRGAFTGADRNKVGRFQAAGRGTLLLDEIDALDVKQQTKLLKVIETGEYELVGSPDAQISEARLIVASNVNLLDLTKQGKFRLDLYYRLNVLEFRLPSVRERPLDLASLAMQFVDELKSETATEVRRISVEFLNALRAYDWPGNLRELKNHLRRAILFCSNGDLTVNDLSHKVIQQQFALTIDRKQSEPSWRLTERVAQSEKELLQDALEANGNNRTRTAKALGISRVGLYKKLRRLGLIGDADEELVAQA